MSATDNLIKGVIQHDLKLVEQAIEEKADVNYVFQPTSTLKKGMWAVYYVATGAIGYIAERLTDDSTIDAKDEKGKPLIVKGDTIMHLAVRYLQGDTDDDSYKILVTLKKAGASFTKNNNHNETPREIIPSRFQGHSSAYDLLTPTLTQRCVIQ